MADIKPLYKKTGGAWVKQDAFQRITGKWVQISSREGGEPSGDPVACLYNGYRLPPLPKRDKALYPYATINSTATMTKITVTLTFRKSWRQDIQLSAGDLPTDAIWRQPGDILYQLTKSGYYPTIGSITATDWGEGVEVTEAKWIQATSVRWSNTDIVSQGSISHDAGELILAATDPVPVYE